MKIKKIALLVALSIVVRSSYSQGFMNLNFEAANIQLDSFGQISATNAFPGWTVIGANVAYDNFSLSGGSITICDTNNGLSLLPPQGKYFAYLASENYPGTGNPFSMGQSVTVSPSSESIIFWGSIGGMQVTFAGQPLNFIVTGSIANYDIYTADISSYAGQTGQLLFTLPPYLSNAILDNIQFSSSPVPEPSALGLSALGGLFFAWRCKRTSTTVPGGCCEFQRGVEPW